MRAIVTGATGTVGTALSRRLAREGWEVTPWLRDRVPVDDYARLDAFLGEVRPDVVFHLAIASRPAGIENEGWKVNWLWPSELAWATRQRGIRFVHTSTAMVFTNDARGPFTVGSVPDAVDGYGGEKLRSERRVFEQNPDATVLRLGWQIGDRPEGNNMLEFFERNVREHGVIRASTRWFPACSFLEDTAGAFLQVLKLPPGLHQVDSNRRWSFFEIASAISALYGGRWPVEASEDFVYDQRLIDEALLVPPLSERLPSLR